MIRITSGWWSHRLLVGVVFFASPSSLHGAIGHHHCARPGCPLSRARTCGVRPAAGASIGTLSVSRLNPHLSERLTCGRHPLGKVFAYVLAFSFPHYSTMSLAGDRRIDALSTNVQSARHITSPAAAAHKCAQHPAGTSNARPARAAWPLDSL
jgi:hypothetical protein